METAKASMRIVEHACSPVVAWRQRDLYFPYAQRFPRRQFVNAFEAKIVHQIPNAVWYDDGLPRGNSAQGSPVQVVEMGVRHQHKIDRGQMLQGKPRTSNTFDDLQPERPDRIHQDVPSPPLD